MAGLVQGQIVVQAKATRNPADGQAMLEDIRALEYDFDSTLLQIDIPASTQYPVYVTEIQHQVITAFSGGTPSINVGDGTTADKYIATAAITETTAGNLARSAVGTKLTAMGKVLVTLSASLSAGKGLLIVKTLRAKA